MDKQVLHTVDGLEAMLESGEIPHVVINMVS